MRGIILMKALEALQYGAEAFVGIAVEPFFVGQRGAAARQLAQLIRDIVNKGADKERDARYYQNLLSRLQRDGLVVVSRAQESWPFVLTRKGIAQLAKLRQRLGEGDLPRSPHYAKESSPMLTIVTFDIPERDRHKRDWLRSALKNLSFRMLQKSVWIGKIKIPEAFFADLRRFKI